MDELARRLEISARHLELVDQYAAEASAEYALMREKLRAVPGYEQLANQLYSGQQGRQMMLGGILLYILTGRGYWTAVGFEQGSQEFVRILLYIANLLLIQETLLSARPEERQRFLRQLEAAQLNHFFASPEERQAYQDLIAFQNRITVGNPRRLYKVMDSVLPRTPGIIYELVVYVHLLIRRLGYSVPLLIIQRLFRGQETLAPPDYLLLRPDGNVIGIEVGGGMGQFSLTQGKIDQVNHFTQDTCIPVITATVPHVYRCDTCGEWITYCDSVIERTAQGDFDSESMSALECPQFGEHPCEHTVYYGRLEPGGNARRHHYSHVLENEYVQRRALRTEDDRGKKLLHYFPYVKGLERIQEVPLMS